MMTIRRFHLKSAVHLFLIRDGQILLLRRFNTGYEDGNYGVVAGHLDGGEQVKSAAIREAEEEVGIQIAPSNLEVVGVMHRQSDDERVDFFLVTETWAGEIVNREPHKCDQLAWFDIDDLPANVIPYIRRAIDNYRQGRWFDSFGWSQTQSAPSGFSSARSSSNLRTNMTDHDAIQLHQDSIIIDALNASHHSNEGVLQRMHAGGITAANVTLTSWQNLAQTMDNVADYNHLFREHEDLITPVRNVADIHQAKATQRVGLIFGFQNTSPIEDNVRLLSVCHAVGVRIIQLTYNHQNLVGAGCMEPTDTGLSNFGRDVVAEMNRLGILIDLSHCGPRTTLDAIEASEWPVAITHANARTFCDHPRNKFDDAIKALVEKGGVIGAVAFPPFVTGGRDATLDDYLDAIESLVDLAGVDHVGVGPDFMEEMPAYRAERVLRDIAPEVKELFLSTPPMTGFESAASFPNVTQGLLARGYSAEDVQKIIGGNWLRLFEAVWHTE